MKDLRKKLAAAVAMLTISAVMLTGVSYAWYTLSTNPEVKGMQTTVVANENLEIALEKDANEDVDDVNARSVFDGTAQGSKTGDYYTWGNLVDLSTAFTTLNAGGKMQIRPVKYTASALQFPKYGEDGRVKELANLTALPVANVAEGTSITGGVYGWSESSTLAAADNFYAYQVNYWLRSNVTGDIVLSIAEKRANDGVAATTTGVNGVEGEGSYIYIPLTNQGAETADATARTTEKAKIDAYLANLKVRFIAGTGEGVFATIDTTSGITSKTENSSTTYYLQYPLELADTVKITTLTANTAQLVKMYVYLDGETVTNADALLDDIQGVKMNIQFDNKNLNDDAMTGTTYTAPGGN